MPLASLLPGRFEIELSSPGLTGTFDALCAVTPAGARLQLFPDVGGKVLDLTIGADRIEADMAGSRYEAHQPLDRAEPHLALALALVVAELLAPVGADRVRGERRATDGVELSLVPALGSGTVTVMLTAAGVIRSYTMSLGWIELTVRADGCIEGRGCRGWLRAVVPGGA